MKPKGRGFGTRKRPPKEDAAAGLRFPKRQKMATVADFLDAPLPASARLAPFIMPEGALRVTVRVGTPEGVRQPKPRGRIELKSYLVFVRSHPCCCCGSSQGIVAHHEGGSRGVGQKVDDYRTNPLTWRCHDHWHATGRLLGRPDLSHEQAEAFLLAVQVDLLIEWAEILAADVQRLKAKRENRKE